jgi:hypothetical protein
LGYFARCKKHPGCEDDRLPSGAEIKNKWNYTSTSPYNFMLADLIKHRDNSFSYLTPLLVLYTSTYQEMCSYLKHFYAEIFEEIFLLKTLWYEYASDLYRLSDRPFLSKLVPTFEERGCHMVSLKDIYGSIIGFLDQSHYISFQVAPQLYSRV